jgi:hypothetical protein
MLASFFRATDRSWPVTFHDDGTCTANIREEMGRVASFARFIPRDEADVKTDRNRESFPRLRAFRHVLPLMIKLTDTGFFCDRSNRLVLDCDMIFFPKPSELLHWEAGLTPESFFLRDVVDASVVAPTEIERIPGDQTRVAVE